MSNGLVVHYEFEDNAYDSSVNEKHGTEYGGVSYVDGVIGKAASFDGVDDYINSGNIETSNIQTFSVWFKTNNDTYSQSIAGDHRPCEYKAGTSFTIYGTEAQDTPRITFHSYGDGTNNGQRAEFNKNFFDNNWYHLVGIVINGQNTKLYINNELVDEYLNGFNADSLNDFLIGKANPYTSSCGYGNSTQFKGQIDDLRIYNRALNEK